MRYLLPVTLLIAAYLLFELMQRKGRKQEISTLVEKAMQEVDEGPQWVPVSLEYYRSCPYIGDLYIPDVLFEQGDLVDWRDVPEQIIGGSNRYPHGPFKIRRVRKVPKVKPLGHILRPDNAASFAHSQWVTIMVNDTEEEYSGWWFKKI